MDVKDKLIKILEDKFELPVFLQGSMNEDSEYPDSFFTIWNNDTPDTSHYDNKATRTLWDFDVNFYSNNPDLVNVNSIEAIKELKIQGFTIDGKGYDAVSDEVTHTGRGVNALYLEKNK